VGHQPVTSRRRHLQMMHSAGPSAGISDEKASTNPKAISEPARSMTPRQRMSTTKSDDTQVIDDEGLPSSGNAASVLDSKATKPNPSPVDGARGAIQESEVKLPYTRSVSASKDGGSTTGNGAALAAGPGIALAPGAERGRRSPRRRRSKRSRGKSLPPLVVTM
jgi:hypothetical protein